MTVAVTASSPPPSITDAFLRDSTDELLLTAGEVAGASIDENRLIVVRPVVCVCGDGSQRSGARAATATKKTGKDAADVSSSERRVLLRIHPIPSTGL
jgi:hypothetical protein